MSTVTKSGPESEETVFIRKQLPPEMVIKVLENLESEQVLLMRGVSWMWKNLATSILARRQEVHITVRWSDAWGYYSQYTDMAADVQVKLIHHPILYSNAEEGKESPVQSENENQKNQDNSQTPGINNVNGSFETSTLSPIIATTMFELNETQSEWKSETKDFFSLYGPYVRRLELDFHDCKESDFESPSEEFLRDLMWSLTGRVNWLKVVLSDSLQERTLPFFENYQENPDDEIAHFIHYNRLPSPRSRSNVVFPVLQNLKHLRMNLGEPRCYPGWNFTLINFLVACPSLESFGVVPSVKDGPDPTLLFNPAYLYVFVRLGRVDLVKALSICMGDWLDYLELHDFSNFVLSEGLGNNGRPIKVLMPRPNFQALRLTAFSAKLVIDHSHSDMVKNVVAEILKSSAETLERLEISYDDCIQLFSSLNLPMPKLKSLKVYLYALCLLDLFRLGLNLENLPNLHEVNLKIEQEAETRHFFPSLWSSLEQLSKHINWSPLGTIDSVKILSVDIQMHKSWTSPMRLLQHLCDSFPCLNTLNVTFYTNVFHYGVDQFEKLDRALGPLVSNMFENRSFSFRDLDNLLAKFALVRPRPYQFQSCLCTDGWWMTRWRSIKKLLLHPIDRPRRKKGFVCQNFDMMLRTTFEYVGDGTGAAEVNRFDTLCSGLKIGLFRLKVVEEMEPRIFFSTDPNITPEDCE